jgi:hypothetical protein
MPAKSGRTSARSDITKEPTSSTVATTKLPRPPVVSVEAARVRTEADWTAPATAPPPMIAADHYRSGSASLIEAAAVTIPATTAAGLAIVSSAWSSQGT